MCFLFQDSVCWLRILSFLIQGFGSQILHFDLQCIWRINAIEVLLVGVHTKSNQNRAKSLELPDLRHRIKGRVSDFWMASSLLIFGQNIN